MTSAVIGNALRLQIGVEQQSSVQSKLAQRLDKCLVTSSKHILKQTIAFQRAKEQTSTHILALKAKYPPLNSAMAPVANVHENNTGLPTQNGSHAEGQDAVLPVEDQFMYPADKVVMNFQHRFKACPGLRNNTGTLCYLNSIVNCLIYTPPLANYLMSGEHRKTCHMSGICIFCLLEEHFTMMRTSAGPQLSKLSRYTNHISKTFRGYAQEDAHECLRGILDNMQRAFWHNYHGVVHKGRFAKETTVVNQIFGGFLRSQVKCMRCKGVSDTYDPFMDLSLDIKFNGDVSIQRALAKYVHPEILRNDNAYKCERCKEKVTAEKRFTIHRAPNIMTIQLKRFGHTMCSNKWSRLCRYTEFLNLRPYMSESQGAPINYQLFGVVNHYGFTCNSGHYTCCIRSPMDGWVRYNDERKDFVREYQVLNSTEAYILFYKKVTPSRPSSGSSSTITSQQAFNQSPVGYQNGQKNALVHPGPPVVKMGSTSKIVFHKNKGKMSNGISQASSSGQLTPLQGQREKVSFQMKSALSTPNIHYNGTTTGLNGTASSGSKAGTSSGNVGDSTRHPLIIKIKDKNKITVCTAANPSQPKANGVPKAAKPKPSNPLVPYNDISDSDEEAVSRKSPTIKSALSVELPSSSAKQGGHTPKRSLPSSPSVKSPVLNGKRSRSLSPSKKVRNHSKKELVPQLSGDLCATVTVPGHIGRLDGVKDSPPKRPPTFKATNGYGQHVSNGDHQYSIMSPSSKEHGNQKRNHPEDSSGLCSTSDDDPLRCSPSKSKKKKKNKKHKHHESSGGGGGDHQQVVWVERTKETLNSSPAKANGTDNGHQERSRGDKPTITTYKHWDGKQRVDHDLERELKKRVTFGSGENSYWDTPSAAKPSYESSGDQHHQEKTWMEEYEEQLDSGHVKKSKNHLANHSFKRNNAFQQYQDRVNRGDDPSKHYNRHNHRHYNGGGDRRQHNNNNRDRFKPWKHRRDTGEHEQPHRHHYHNKSYGGSHHNRYYSNHAGSSGGNNSGYY